MWMVIHMIKSLSAAELLRDRLTAEGFLIRLRPVSHSADAQEAYYELLVPRAEAEEARRVLFDQNLFEIS